LIEMPVERAFELSDGNGDGSLTQDEAAQALGRLSRSLGIPALDTAQPSKKEPSKAKKPS
jgi:hypothetical protein